MDECVDSLSEAADISTLHANSGYRKVKIDESHGDMTAFSVRQESYGFISIIYAYRNASGSDQRRSDVKLADVKWQFGLIKLNNISIHIKFAEEHTGHVRTVVTLFKNAVVTSKFKEGIRFTMTNILLGHAKRPCCKEIASKWTDANRRLRHWQIGPNWDRFYDSVTYLHSQSLILCLLRLQYIEKCAKNSSKPSRTQRIKEQILKHPKECAYFVSPY